ncbi:hypothetical protein [Tessaracoccus lapidicaptus]|uniref:hypothetical protein n=1 Tax=Tessaracoccus lapidicaptus TaxID=1427523 RepID=UPI00333F2268
MTNALVPGLGGPMGQHARPRGIWFDALPWAVAVGTASFLVLFLRHTLCVQTEVGVDINAYARLCYSDVQTMVRGLALPAGASPFDGSTLAVAPLVGVLLLGGVAVARLVGIPVGPTATDQQQLDASVVAVGAVTVTFYLCFLVWIVTSARWGRRAPGRPSWVAMLVAASPIVAASGLVSWDLLPVALTSAALALLSRGRAMEAGIILGLAASAGTMPIGIALAVTVGAWLRGAWPAAARVGLPALVTWFVVHAPLLATRPGAVFAFYHGEVHKERGYGSLWYLLELLGKPVRHAGSLAFVMLAVFLLAGVAYLYVTRRRPRDASLIAVVVLAAVVVGPSFPPQTSLWVLLVVLLARPFRPELIAATVAHVGYYLAIWGWLAGSLTLAQYGPYGVYWGAIIVRTAVDAWILLLALRDTRAAA